MTPTCRGSTRQSCALACVLVVLTTSLAATRPAPATAAMPVQPIPVLAYYYIWFNATSWTRAKTDLPLLGRYSSDESAVMRQHVRMAKSAGIAGFIVSWKNTPTLDRRLERLIAVANQSHFKLAVIYEGLDFERRPLAPNRIAADLDFFARRYANNPAFRVFDKPLVIWSGTWEFTRPQVANVTRTVRRHLLVLATEKDAAGYERVADVVDGDAYYWSSVNPETYPRYPKKLVDMGNAVHTKGGLWIAPAAVGFDARLVGGKTIVERGAGDAAHGNGRGAGLLARRHRADQLERVQRELAHRAEPQVRSALLGRARRHPRQTGALDPGLQLGRAARAGNQLRHSGGRRDGGGHPRARRDDARRDGVRRNHEAKSSGHETAGAKRAYWSITFINVGLGARGRNAAPRPRSGGIMKSPQRTMRPWACLHSGFSRRVSRGLVLMGTSGVDRGESAAEWVCACRRCRCSDLVEGRSARALVVQW